MSKGTMPRFIRRCFFLVLFLSLIIAGGGCRRSGFSAASLTPDGVEYALTLEGDRCLRFSVPELSGAGRPKVEISEADEDGWRRVRMTWDVASAAAQDELAARFDLDIAPDFWWAPHLAPEEGYVVAQHVFRSPAIITAQGPLILAVVPDLDIVGRRTENPWFLDYDAPARRFWLGLAKTDVPVHTLFKKAPGMTLAPGKVELGFYVTAYRGSGTVPNPWSKTSAFL